MVEIEGLLVMQHFRVVNPGISHEFSRFTHEPLYIKKITKLGWNTVEIATAFWPYFLWQGKNSDTQQI